MVPTDPRTSFEDKISREIQEDQGPGLRITLNVVGSLLVLVGYYLVPAGNQSVTWKFHDWRPPNPELGGSSLPKHKNRTLM